MFRDVGLKNDTTVRIGVWLNLRPDKVYLHCGTRDGAKTLGLDTRDGVLEIADLPAALRKLAPDDIENFLCICKSRLKPIRVTKFRNRSA